MIRETPPHFWRAQTYAARWWRTQEPWFYPRWYPERKPDPQDLRDPIYDTGWYAGLVADGVLLPAQFWTRRLAVKAPEQKLFEAVIDSARSDIELYYLPHTDRRRTLFERRRMEDAWEWIFSDDLE